MNIKQIIIDNCTSGEASALCSLAFTGGFVNGLLVEWLLDISLWVLIHLTLVYLVYTLTGKYCKRNYIISPIRFAVISIFSYNITLPLCASILGLYGFNVDHELLVTSVSLLKEVFYE